MARHGAGRQPAQIAEYYGDHSNRVRQIAGLYRGHLPSLVRQRLVAHSRGALVLAAGAVTAALLFAASALWATTAVTVQHERGFALDPSTHLVIEDAGFVLFLAAMAFVAAVSVAILRTGKLPTVLGLLGFPVAVTSP